MRHPFCQYPLWHLLGANSKCRAGSYTRTSVSCQAPQVLWFFFFILSSFSGSSTNKKSYDSTRYILFGLRSVRVKSRVHLICYRRARLDMEKTENDRTLPKWDIITTSVYSSSYFDYGDVISSPHPSFFSPTVATSFWFFFKTRASDCSIGSQGQDFSDQYVEILCLCVC